MIRFGAPIVMMVVSAASLIASGASAQPAVQLSPTLDISQRYDSNVFLTADREQSDYVTRVSPGLEMRYRGRIVTVMTRYGFDAERFTEHGDLTSVDAHRALVDVHYYPTRRITFATAAAFTQTQVPGELNTVSGFITARARAQRLSVRPSITGELGRRTRAVAEYEASDDRLAGSIGLGTQTATLRFERNYSERTAATVGYTVQQFAFTAPAQAQMPTLAQVMTVELTHELSRRAGVRLQAGPRLTAGRARPEIALSIHTTGLSSGLSLQYARTQATVLGLAAPADVQSIATTARFKPWSPLHLDLSPGWFRMTSPGVSVDVAHARVEASLTLAPTLALAAAYDGNFQQGSRRSAAASPALRTIARHVVSISVVKSAATERQ
jgi:uncharacterized protein (PEP-CTERM system associated)